MLLVSTTEYPADPAGKLVGTEQSLGLYYLAFGVDPLGLYRIEPGALGGQKAWHYPHSAAAVCDLAVVGGDPGSDLSALVPAGIVPDHKQGLSLPAAASLSQQ